MQRRNGSRALFLVMIEVQDSLTGAGLADADAVRLEIAARVLADGHAPKIAGAHDDDMRLGSHDVAEICDGQSVAFLSPPRIQDALGRDDDIRRVHMSVDLDLAEPICPRSSWWSDLHVYCVASSGSYR